jgi:uncharacterized lipoprotein NlpE involved in copper resistance
MKKIIPVFAALMLAFGSSAYSQASKAPQPKPSVAGAAHDLKNNPDLYGIYAGTLPSASGSGIEVTMILRPDSTYTVLYHYIAQEEDDVTSGTFRLDKAKGIVKLDAKDLPPYYRIDKNRLTQLDMEGDPITGELADDYVLLKK